MHFSEFIKSQETVYSRFRRTKIKKLGTLPDPFIDGHRRSGYFIALRYPTEIAKAVEELSFQIAETAPVMIYDKDKIHTTLSDFSLGRDVPCDTKVLDRLVEIASVVESQDAPEIEIHDLLCNRNTVILAGSPNEQFVNLSNIILSQAQKSGINLREPWGAHITVARFSQTVAPEHLENFFELINIKEYNFGVVSPNRVDIGYFRLNPITIINYRSFELKV